MEFRNDIQGLRAIAVILVFVFHLSDSWLPGGFIGVDVFFVISGYLVSSIILNKVSKGTFSVVSFYESRIKRIVPAYLFLLLITAVVVAYIFVRSDIYSFRKSLFWSIVFNSNNYFSTVDNYFGASSYENPFLHTWTIAVEMQFYFILPLLLMLIRSKKVLIYVLLVISLLLIGYSTYNIHNGKSTLMYFSLLSRMPEFLLGVLIAATGLRNHNFVKNNSNWIGLIGLIIIGLCAVFYDDSLPFPGVTALLPCLASVFILIASNSYVNDFLSKKPLVYIGAISYSIYLWHWPIMATLRYYNNAYELSNIEKITVLGLTAMISVISYYLIEKRMRKLSGFHFYVPFVGLSSLTVSMILIVVTINKSVYKDNAEYMYPSHGLSSHGSTFSQVGVFGDTTIKDSGILLIGDSHALNMKKYFEILGLKNNFSFRTITNDGVPTIPGLTNLEITEDKLYKQYNHLIEQVNKELPRSKLIIVQFTGDGQSYLTAIRQMMSGLKEDQRVLFIEDFPRIDKNPVRINKDIVKNDKIEQKYEKLYKPISQEVQDFINSDKRARFVNISASKVFADAPYYADTLTYYDGDHMNEYGARIYAADTESVMMQAINWGLNVEI